MQTRIKTAILFFLLILHSNINAGEWKFGAQFSHAAGISDVVDQYDKNLRAQGFIVSDVAEIPVGIGFKSRFDTSSGLLVGIDIGPAFFIYGDVSHYELPVFATVGYSFLPELSVSPFLKVGASYHIASGEFVGSSSPGLFASAGLTIGKNWGVEVAVDESTVEIDEIRDGGSIDINTYDMIISVFALF